MNPTRPISPSSQSPSFPPLSLENEGSLSEEISRLFARQMNLQDQNRELQATILPICQPPLRHITTQYPPFQFPISAPSFNYQQNATDYLEGRIQNWSCQQALQMCCFFYSQAQPEKAKTLFFSHALSSFINEREVFERELALFLSPEDSSDSDLIVNNRKAILIDLLKQMLFNNSSLVLRLAPEIYSWILDSEKNTPQFFILQGYDYRKQKNYPAALRCYEEAAKLGSPMGYLEIGDCYLEEEGVEQNDRKAFECYTNAAYLGAPLAFVKMGDRYSEGKGVEQNHQNAFACYIRGAELGCPLAFTSIGICYSYGRGVERNDQLAAQFFQKGAKLGCDEAFVEIGNCYLIGKGVEQNDQKAFEYCRKGAQLGSTLGFTTMGICFWKGKGVPQDDRLAVQCFEKGDMGHQFCIAKSLSAPLSPIEDRSLAKILLQVLIFRQCPGALEFYSTHSFQEGV